MAKDQKSAHSEFAATPTSACRIPIFSPTRRPQAVSAWRVETSWGWAEITGRLGQQHRDLLDAARMVAEREEWTADGNLHLKVDPARLRAAMGGDATNWQRILEWLQDMRVASVVAHVIALNETIYGGLISEFKTSNDTTILSSRPGAFNSNRRYLRITFSTGWSKLIEEDLATKYPLAKVVALKHGFSQAVARFCLSHTTVNDDVAGLMEKLAAKGRMRDRRSELEDDEEGLAALGIGVSGNQVKWQQARAKSGGARAESGGREQSPVKNALPQLDQ